MFILIRTISKCNYDNKNYNQAVAINADSNILTRNSLRKYNLHEES